VIGHLSIIIMSDINPNQEVIRIINASELQTYHHEDEVSLVDLWRVLSKRKKLIWGITFSLIILGIVAALVIPKKYEYKSILQIGMIKDKPIEDVETAKSKLQNSFLPLVLVQYHNENPDEPIPNFNVSVPKNSQVVMLSSKAPESQGQQYIELQNKIAALLAKDHSVSFEKYENEISHKLKVVELEVAALKDERLIKMDHQAIERKAKAKENTISKINDDISLTVEKIKGIDRLEKLKTKQLSKANSQISEFRQVQMQLAKGTGTESQKILTRSMVDSEIHRLLNKEAELEQYLSVNLRQEREALHKKQDELIRTKNLQKSELENIKAELMKFDFELEQKIEKKNLQLASLQLQLRNSQPTKMIVPPQRSAKPVGPGRKVIVALSGILGLMLGIFVAFFAEFLNKVKEKDNLVMN
jgi:LPS O-antigen subunit length determinant protein (WzzB/FepE family)